MKALVRIIPERQPHTCSAFVVSATLFFKYLYVNILQV